MFYKVKQVENKDINWEEIPKANINKFKWENNEYKPLSNGQMVLVKDYGFIVKLESYETPYPCKKLHDGEQVCEDSTLEVFLRFNEEGYINLETNHFGARKQGFRLSREEKIYINNKNFMGFDCKVDKSPNYWSVTIEIPFERLFCLYTKLKKEDFKGGFIFTGNFYKICESNENNVRHYGMWQEIDKDVPDFHQPEQFGTFIIG